MNTQKGKVQLDKSKKDHFLFSIDGVQIGEYELSELRYIIQQIDNKL